VVVGCLTYFNGSVGLITLVVLAGLLLPGGGGVGKMKPPRRPVHWRPLAWGFWGAMLVKPYAFLLCCNPVGAHSIRRRVIAAGPKLAAVPLSHAFCSITGAAVPWGKYRPRGRGAAPPGRPPTRSAGPRPGPGCGWLKPLAGWPGLVFIFHARVCHRPPSQVGRAQQAARPLHPPANRCWPRQAGSWLSALHPQRGDLGDRSAPRCPAAMNTCKLLNWPLRVTKALR